MKTMRATVPILFLFIQYNVLGDSPVNAWIKPSSGYWEEATSWSLGTLPDSSQSVSITNSGWKAVALGGNTAQNFPQSMQIQDLQIASPVDSYNVLLMNFCGFEVPLQMTSLNVGTNSSVIVQGSSLEDSGGVALAGNFYQGDFSAVNILGALQIVHPKQYASDTVAPAVYALTNGTLSVSGGEYIGGGFRGPGQFVQYGGAHNAGGSLYVNDYTFGSIMVNFDGELDIYGGQLTATNPIIVGIGDYANGAYFHQYGGTVMADTIIDGHYILEGGTITGRMSVIGPNFYQRADAFVLQTGGTNWAASLDMAHPNKYGGRAFYTLSNGVVRVDSSLAFNGGRFAQYNGQTTIASNLLLQGYDLGPFGIATADYLLQGGTLSAGGISVEGATFQQNAGSNSIAGDLVLMASQPPPPLEPPKTDSYVLAGGSLTARNVIVNATWYGGFHQTGGANQISEKLTTQGVSAGAYYYTLEGGTLSVKDISVADGAFFQHRGGNIVHSGALTLGQGEWRAAATTQALGPLLLSVGATNNISAITFPSGASSLRLANSSAQPWNPSATLYITNWHGSTAGGGDTRLYFGSDSAGLTSPQLAQIQFSISGTLHPAKILATGEVVPDGTATLDFTRSGNTGTFRWEPGWTLQSSPDLTGPYQDVPGASSPYSTSLTQQRAFFRLRR